jgi:hypothetical protein
MANNKIDNSKDPNMVMVYEDGKGNKWFSHVNVLEISPARGVSASKADRFVSLRINEKNLIALLDKAIEGVNNATKPDFVGMASIVHEIRRRLAMACEETSLLDLSAIYYFLQDEDPRFPSHHHDNIKRKIWEDDELCRSFFLHMSLGLTKQFSNMSEEDLLKFLMNSQVKEMAERIYQFIPRQ